MKSLFHKQSYKVFDTTYFSNEGMRLLYESPLDAFVDFPECGSDLCIAILNYNRVDLTIKLLHSIELRMPEFRGEILIIDNNSAPEQLERLGQFVSTSPLTVTVNRQESNQGVGRARNIAAAATDKYWIMFLDSDMYFIQSPLAAIRETVSGLGVSFMNLPIVDYDRESVFALGGALFMSPLENGLVAGGGSVFDLQKTVSFKDVHLEQPFLSDFLFGGSAVLDRKKFISLGGFDPGMFIGFEDTDFSLRLYKEGIKIGNIPAFTVVHDHKLPENQVDRAVEKERYSNDIIRKSGDVFFAKHGISIYDQYTKDWLKEKQDSIDAGTIRGGGADDKKPTVTLVVDKKNWAFHNIAVNIVNSLSNKFAFSLLFTEDYQGEKWVDLYYNLYRNKTDIVYFFWRTSLFFFDSYDVVAGLAYRHQLMEEELHEYLNSTILLTSVYDHLFLNADYKAAHHDFYDKFMDGYTVSSETLHTIYSAEFPNSPFCTIQDGIDLAKFYVREGVRSLPVSKGTLTVGWVGNSNWGMSEDGLDHKGFHSIILPAIEALQAKGLNIILRYADSAEPETLIAHEEMIGFYHTIDVYLCLSDIEGTPNTVLEAMACGCAVISTDVGIVREAFGKAQSDFILVSRDITTLTEKIAQLYNNPSLLADLSRENTIRIRNWSWKSKTELFDLFFSAALRKGPKQKRIVHTTCPATEAEQTVSVPKAVHIAGTAAKHRISEKKLAELQNWYNEQYEVLPLWYKRFGHIIKIISGKRNLKRKQAQ